MTLIFILIALAADLLSVDLERLRKFDWLMSLYNSLNQRFVDNEYWDGNLGLLFLLSSASEKRIKISTQRLVP